MSFCRCRDTAKSWLLSLGPWWRSVLPRTIADDCTLLSPANRDDYNRSYLAPPHPTRRAKMAACLPGKGLSVKGPQSISRWIVGGGGQVDHFLFVIREREIGLARVDRHGQLRMRSSTTSAAVGEGGGHRPSIDSAPVTSLPCGCYGRLLRYPK